MVRSLIVRFVFLVAPTAICASGYAQIPPIPSSTQRSIERIVGISGSYAANESVFKIRIPRTDITLALQGRGVTTGFPIESWVAFSPDIRGGGLVMSELQLLEGEVNPVASAALDSGLNITGLGNTMLFDQPRLLTMNLSGTGSFDKLASGIRKCLDSISAAGAGKTGAAVRSEFPATSTIEGGPIDTILSMKGTLTNGIYRAAIGQITVLNNTPFGKEMGAVTSVVFSGTNQNAMVQGEIVVTVDQLQGVLKALRSKRLDLISIRNHTIAEHPQLVFVRFQGSGSATDLAKAVRYALDVQVGAVKPPA
ncbi:MAG: hypothetical protein AUG12_00990 [Acidobacteria bacterium 13_1_20CM_2_57_8]|nr:MAG: hypothetical protein AUG12_00990 [Acidobacteria bacterium 13_1_20CM_2_57_8]